MRDRSPSGRDEQEEKLLGAYFAGGYGGALIELEERKNRNDGEDDDADGTE